MNWTSGCNRKMEVKNDSTYFVTSWKGRVATEIRRMMEKAIFSPTLFSYTGRESDVFTDVFSKTE